LKNIVKQAIRFIGLSGIGWILDFCTYTGLTFILSNVVVINFISSWVGVTFVFMLATRNIFKNNSKISLKWKYLIYLSYQLVLIFLISKLLGEINQWIVNNARIELMQRFSGIISKIIVTPITMVLNFIVMKNVIEKI
jgi:putative flippase GtrA